MTGTLASKPPLRGAADHAVRMRAASHEMACCFRANAPSASAPEYGASQLRTFGRPATGRAAKRQGARGCRRPASAAVIVELKTASLIATRSRRHCTQLYRGMLRAIFAAVPPDRVTATARAEASPRTCLAWSEPGQCQRRLRNAAQHLPIHSDACHIQCGHGNRWRHCGPARRFRTAPDGHIEPRFDEAHHRRLESRC